MTLSLQQDINKEWEKFVCSNYTNLSSDEEDDEEDEEDEEDEFKNFDENIEIIKNIRVSNIESELKEAPKASDIYISTKTKIAYLNMPIDLKLFWNIPVISYYTPQNGVIKKQIKVNCASMEELLEIQEKLKQEKHYNEHIITSINNPNGRIKFKDIRKISIGLCKKDIMSYRCKKKSAFYNCFVLILRMKVDQIFKEFHVKVFNTGKLEIPGIQRDDVFDMVLEFVKNILQSYILDFKLEYKHEFCETVLINSNFNCGFFINRENFYDILKMKYNIQAIFDPCSYPGIQCKFYYNPELGVQTGSQISQQNKHLYKNIKKVSFMIFRTGSVLIVGKCDESVLRIIYKFLVDILKNEYHNIKQNFGEQIDNADIKKVNIKDKKKKIRKKNIMVNV
jgi:TATA-box binding protein (TBP) (component of TFIID and TFIIIB)